MMKEANLKLCYFVQREIINYEQLAVKQLTQIDAKRKRSTHNKPASTVGKPAKTVGLNLLHHQHCLSILVLKH